MLSNEHAHRPETSMLWESPAGYFALLLSLPSYKALQHRCRGLSEREAEASWEPKPAKLYILEPSHFTFMALLFSQSDSLGQEYKSFAILNLLKQCGVFCVFLIFFYKHDAVKVLRISKFISYEVQLLDMEQTQLGRESCCLQKCIIKAGEFVWIAMPYKV